MKAGDTVWIVEDYDGQIDVVAQTVQRVSGDRVVFDAGNGGECVQNVYPSPRAAWASVVERMERDVETYRAIRDAAAE